MKYLWQSWKILIKICIIAAKARLLNNVEYTSYLGTPIGEFKIYTFTKGVKITC